MSKDVKSLPGEGLGGGRKERRAGGPGQVVHSQSLCYLGVGVV